MPTQEHRRCEYEQYSWGTLVKHCTRTTKLVERDGQWYCWQHDPVRVAAKAEAKSRQRKEAMDATFAQWEHERVQAPRRRQAEQEAAALIVRLATEAPSIVKGNMYTDWGMRTETAEQIMALAARLEATE